MFWSHLRRDHISRDAAQKCH